MMFGGSPISVAVPPMFEAITSAIRNGTGSTSRRVARRRASPGAISSTVVTLSSRALSSAVTSEDHQDHERLAAGELGALIAMYSKSPVCRRMLTMTIIR